MWAGCDGEKTLRFAWEGRQYFKRNDMIKVHKVADLFVIYYLFGHT